MIITPPNDEPFEGEIITITPNHDIRAFLDVKHWKCPECGSVIFGRCEDCVYCKLKLRKIVKRPE